MNISTPPDATTASVTETPGYITLCCGDAALTLSVLPRPGNHSETIYLSGGALLFEPGEPPVIAAVLSCAAGQVSLTLYPLPEAETNQPLVTATIA